MSDSNRTEWLVGLLVLAAMVILGVGITLVGSRDQLFTDKVEYKISFAAVNGLSQGSPVQLDGVAVGTVTNIFLSPDPAETRILTTVEIDERYASRIREDSAASLGTLGLLGDKYVDISSGTTETEVVPPGGFIPNAPTTELDQLLASGEDVMDNLIAISSSLRTILDRAERGEGLLGELTMNQEKGRRITDVLIETLDGVQRVTDRIESGQGTVTRLLDDPTLAERLTSAVGRLDTILEQVETGEGLLPRMIDDPALAERFASTLGQLETTSGHLATFSERLESGDGLLPMLLEDEEFRDRFQRDVESILERVDTLTRKLTEGDGTAARLINDPEIYQAIDDILVGVDESWILRWLIRNRQRQGIEQRFEDTLEEQGLEPPTAEERRQIERRMREQEANEETSGEDPPAAGPDIDTGTDPPAPRPSPAASPASPRPSDPPTDRLPSTAPPSPLP